MGDTRAPSSGESHDLERALLEDLAEAFDLRYAIGGRSLGSRVEERLRSLSEREEPAWGTTGNPTEVSSLGSPNLRFVYRPHLFPGMDPKLRIAHELQFDLLPTELPPRFPLVVSAVLESYCHLSGDLFGWRTLPSGAVQLWVIDVSGHGVRSGLAAAVVKILLDDAPVAAGPADLLHWLHGAFLESRNAADEVPLYATGVVIETSSLGRSRLSSAGHQPGFLRHPEGRLQELAATGWPFGLIEDLELGEHSFSLEPETLLLLFTDGVVETESADGEAFGSERLRRLVEDAPSDLTVLTRSIHQAVIEHNGERLLDDDLTFVAMRLR